MSTARLAWHAELDCAAMKERPRSQPTHFSRSCCQPASSWRVLKKRRTILAHANNRQSEAWTALREHLPAAFRKDTPPSLDDLKSIEAHVEALVSRVSPAVVAVRIGGATGSGVVISADGLVLCAAHVCVEPNRNVLFIFPDGKTARGKTLGTNHDMDSGLMKITENGPWPHVEIGDLNQARLGDWVLALGHPGGFDRKRSMVVRLGRIIRLGSGALQTDCTLIGGDSGEPLLDMHGRVIGIHSRISDSTAANFHVPIGTFLDTWDRLAKGENWGDGRPPPPSLLASGVWIIRKAAGWSVWTKMVQLPKLA